MRTPPRPCASALAWARATHLTADRGIIEPMRQPVASDAAVCLLSFAAGDSTSRFFAPGSAIDEGPVTRPAHCVLGPFWRERRDKGEMVGGQASARCGGVRLGVAGERVRLGGQAVTVLGGDVLG
jgi:predicted PhzF superfamily epimerase YddE/YHI9